VVASGQKRFSCTIIHCSGGRFVQETMPYVTNVLNWMKQQYKVEFDEMACDFVLARDHKWYFINLRGILLKISV
jgi:LMBR1 domain-containing protein 1